MTDPHQGSASAAPEPDDVMLGHGSGDNEAEEIEARLAFRRFSAPRSEPGGPARDPGYPYGEFDARKWAAEFDRIFGSLDSIPDPDTMLTWFANAIMTGYDAAMNRVTGEAADRAAPAEPATGDSAWLRVRAELDRLLVDAHGVPDDERDQWATRLARSAVSGRAAPRSVEAGLDWDRLWRAMRLAASDWPLPMNPADLRAEYRRLSAAEGTPEVKRP